MAAAHEARSLLCGVGVDRAAQPARLIGDDADRPSLHARERADDVACPARRELEQLAAVDQVGRDVADVVDLARAARHVAPGVARRLGPRHHVGRARTGARRQVAQQVAHEQRRGVVVVGLEVRDAVGRLDARAAELVERHDLAHHLVDHSRAGQEHARLARHHDEVGQRGRVGAAARARAGDHRDLRDAPGQRHDLGEDLAVARQRSEALLQPRATRFDEADDGHARLGCKTQHGQLRACLLLAQAAAHERDVLRVAGHGPARDRAEPRDDSVAVLPTPVQAPRAHAGADQLERPGVAERFEAGERREPLGCAGRERAHASAATPRRQMTALCPPNPNEFEIATGGLPFTSSGRVLPGT